MSRTHYQDFNFGPARLRLIAQANQILNEYAEQGYTLTLRQLYYQFVARDLLPNLVRSYKNLGAAINDARLAGLIDWSAIEDMTRSLRGMNTVPGWISWQKQAQHSFHLDMWANQPIRVEVWVEKDALLSIVGPAAIGERVNYFSCRGFTSQSAMWEAAQRILSYMVTGQSVVVIHLGDHDPSGIDMSRDIETRLKMFLDKDSWNQAVADERPLLDQLIASNSVGNSAQLKVAAPEEYQRLVHAIRERAATYGKFTFSRIALNMDQIEELTPPPNPAKTTDSRYASYRDAYGEDSWELDALPPQYMDDLIRSNVRRFRDENLWRARMASERSQRKLLLDIADHPGAVRRALEGVVHEPSERGRTGRARSGDTPSDPPASG